MSMDHQRRVLSRLELAERARLERAVDAACDELFSLYTEGELEEMARLLERSLCEGPGLEKLTGEEFAPPWVSRPGVGVGRAGETLEEKLSFLASVRGLVSGRCRELAGDAR